MKSDVLIADVFARDGVQSIPADDRHPALTIREKVQLIYELDGAGVPEIEVAGFAHPRAIPALADAAEVVSAIAERPPSATTRALVPNLKGAERAIEAGVRKLSCLIVVSDTYQRLNANMTLAENLEQVAEIAVLARQNGVSLMAGVGTSFVCPYEGVISGQRLREVLAAIVELDIDEIYLADSAGLAWPALVHERCVQALQDWPMLRLGVHLHTLAGLGLANAWAAYESGVRRFDASVGGVGGGVAMPVSTERMGNVATEDLVYMFESSGISTGIDARRLARTGQAIKARVGRGSAYVSDFGSLDRFLEMTRGSLEARHDRQTDTNATELDG